MGYVLHSGVERARAAPDTFWLPSDDAKAAVGIGQYVKLIFGDDDGAERMWVKVTARDGDCLRGTLANNPYALAGLKHGDEVEFGPDHIIQILEADEE